jgi:hypothetical protein
MKSIRISTFALLALPMFALAGESGGAPNEGQKEAAAKAAGDSQVEKVALATTLVQWGRSSNSAEALMAAAQIMMEVPAEGQDKKKESKAGSATAAEKADEAPPTLDPAALAKEALDIAKKEGDKNLAKSIEAQIKAAAGGASRGAVGGPKYGVTKIMAGYTDVYVVEYRGGELAEIAISGDGDTDLDIYVYDENGNFIGSDTGSQDTGYVSWYPKWTGPFRVEVVNRGSVYNQYVMVTN